MNPSDTPQDDNQRGVQVPARDQAGLKPMGRDEAADLMRKQIDSLYADDDTTTPPSKSAYAKTHSESTDHDAASTDTPDWKHYHSSWQSYYQQYYERYYLHQLRSKQHGNTQGAQAVQSQTPKNPSGVVASGPVTRDEAVNELRGKILDEVRERSTKVKRSRHFMPIVAAISVALLFGILQYNRLLVAQVKAYVSPGAIEPQNVIIDPTASTVVGPEPKVVIPKINVDAPVVYDVTSLEENYIQNKLRDGVVHYPIPGADGFPGQTGNTVILGHSSNDVFDDGAYKFVFVQLEKLEKGDVFYLNYNGVRHTYRITEKKVIDPTQVGELVIDSDKPLATLVTCTPPGTALKRLVVIGEQISPDPSTAQAKESTAETNVPSSISGNSRTLFERLFGN